MLKECVITVIIGLGVLVKQQNANILIDRPMQRENVKIATSMLIIRLRGRKRRKVYKKQRKSLSKSVALKNQNLKVQRRKVNMKQKRNLSRSVALKYQNLKMQLRIQLLKKGIRRLIKLPPETNHETPIKIR